MFDTMTTLTIVATFLLAGTVKGVIGLGLPTICLALLTIAIDLPSAMALLLVSSFVTNIWQAFAGKNTKNILHRLWPFLLCAAPTVWIGAAILRQVELSILSAFLGILLIIYSTINLIGIRFSILPKNEVWVGVLLGLVNGILTGMTGTFMIPGVLYFQAIGFKRDILIQAMGMLFTVSTLALAFALNKNELLNTEQLVTSCVALIPAIVGMMIGQRIRKKMPEKRFRRIFFISLILLGSYIIARSCFM